MHSSAFRRVLCRQVRTLPKKQLPVPSAEKRLDIAIIGSPNAGKSVLLNQLIKTRVAAVSKKKHTTRSEILGVYNFRNIQLAFYDTPGFVRDQDSQRLDTKTLKSIVTSATAKADVVLLVVDSVAHISDRVKMVFTEMVKMALDSAKTEVILVLNKVDLVEPKAQLLDITFEYVSLINGVKLKPDEQNLACLDTTTFMVAALHNDGLIDIKNYLLSLAKRRPWAIARDRGVTALTLHQRVEEAVLQALLDHTHEEVPYVADIECEKIKALTQTRSLVEVTVMVDNGAQQKIIIGHQGRTLVKLRQVACELLEEMMGKEIILTFNVRIRGDDTDRQGNEK